MTDFNKRAREAADTGEMVLDAMFVSGANWAKSQFQAEIDFQIKRNTALYDRNGILMKERDELKAQIEVYSQLIQQALEKNQTVGSHKDGAPKGLIIDYAALKAKLKAKEINQTLRTYDGAEEP